MRDMSDGSSPNGHVSSLAVSIPPMSESGDIGSAVVQGGGENGDSRPAVRVDGDCLLRTLDRLRAGHSGKPMSAETLDSLRDQAESLLAKIVSAYAEEIAPTEVGATGSARAADTPPSSGACPTGLLYGRIQSGKTAAMVVATAMAIDNGFRVIVVLTANYEKLVEQTVKRFRALDGPLIYACKHGAHRERLRLGR